MLFFPAMCLAAAMASAPRPSPAASSPSAHPTRARFLALIDRPKVPLTPEAAPIPGPAGLAEFHFSFASDAKQRVPGIMILPSGAGRHPVVILLHGTGGNKLGQLPLARRLARRGFIAVAIDGRYHGERSRAGTGTADYNAAIVRAWEGSGEHPFFYDTVWDVMRLIDYLQTRDDVDSARIGLIGISKGGIETYLTAAVDPRIAVAVPCIGVESFRWALDQGKWQPRIGTIQAAFDAIAKETGSAKDGALVKRFYDRVTPGIYGPFDCPAMLPLIAPRPLLTINGELDAKTPPASLKECTDAARAAYHRLGADDHFVVCVEKNTGHHVNEEATNQAIDWFVRWLHP